MYCCREVGVQGMGGTKLLYTQSNAQLDLEAFEKLMGAPQDMFEANGLLVFTS